MTPQNLMAAFDQQMAKQAAGRLARVIQYGAQQAGKAKTLAKSVADNAVPTAKRLGEQTMQQARTIAADPAAAATQALAGAKTLPGRAMDAVGNLGNKTLNKTRSGLNYLDDEIQTGLNTQRPRKQPLGDRTIGTAQARQTKVPYAHPSGTGQFVQSADYARNPLNMAAGIGTLGAGGAAAYGASGMFGGGGSVPAARSPMPMQQQQGGGGLMDMYNNLPIEARYAIGAGVPLALMGAFAGGSGNSGLGMGMGAAGLGLAGLGAAQGGYLGKNMQGGAQSIMNMLNGGGRGQDPHYNAYLQGNLRNDLDNNSGRSVKKSNALQNFGALVEKASAGRCWTGYEPVPGKAPYSNDSCRPKGQKAKKKPAEKPAEKAAIAGCGVTSMSVTPSSRGTVKKISDHMANTFSPEPTDAENQIQKASQAYQWAAQLRADMDKEAFLSGMVRSVGDAIGGAGNYVQTGLNNFADRSEQAGKDMYYGGMRTLNKITAPINQAGAAVGGFIQGGIQGAKNIAALPGQAATAAGNAIQSGVDTAKSYVPSVRNPFHYPGQPGQPAGAM